MLGIVVVVSEWGFLKDGFGSAASLIMWASEAPQARIGGFLERHKRSKFQFAQQSHCSPSTNTFPFPMFRVGVLSHPEARLWGGGDDFTNVCSLEELTEKVAVSQATQDSGFL